MVVSSDFEESHVPILNSLMRKVLADVGVLGTLASADNMVSPFDGIARRIVLKDWGVIVWCVANCDDR